MGEEQVEAPVIPACTTPPHHWIVGKGTPLPAVCKKCGATRTFDDSNSSVYTRYDYELVSRVGRLLNE